MSLRDGKELVKQSNKKWHRKESFSRSSENITASNKKSTFKKEPTSVSKITITITIIFEQNYHNSTTLSIWVFIHKRVSKNSIVSKDVISTSFDIT